MEIFLREYGMTIAIANIIAWPLAYLVVDNWLQNYQYRVQQDLFTYLLVAVCVFGFAFSMIIAQCLKSARANPVGALRSE
jgi:putative ABC transport system permease protein